MATKREISEHVNVTVPNIFLGNLLSQWIFPFIAAKVECGCKINQAAADFQAFVKCDEDNLSMESILMAYNRKREELRMFNRHDAENWLEKGQYKSKQPIVCKKEKVQVQTNTLFG